MTLGTKGYQQLYVDGLTDVSTEAKYNLGTERIEDGVKYIYVQNTGPLSTAVGYGQAYHQLCTYVLSTDSTAGEMCGGVAVSVIPANSYGWVAKKGPVTVYSTAGLTAQKPIALSTAGVFADADASSVFVCGQSGATVAGTKSGTVNLDC